MVRPDTEDVTEIAPEPVIVGTAEVVVTEPDAEPLRPVMPPAPLDDTERLIEPAEGVIVTVPFVLVRDTTPDWALRDVTPAPLPPPTPRDD